MPHRCFHHGFLALHNHHLMIYGLEPAFAPSPAEHIGTIGTIATIGTIEKIGKIGTIGTFGICPRRAWFFASIITGRRGERALTHYSLSQPILKTFCLACCLATNYHRSHRAWQAPLCCHPLAAPPPGNDGDKEPSLLSFAFDTSNTVDPN